jgi:lysophospholipid acyltransferase (LPLAT)-like uncharacterized protein
MERHRFSAAPPLARELQKAQLTRPKGYRSSRASLGSSSFCSRRESGNVRKSTGREEVLLQRLDGYRHYLYAPHGLMKALRFVTAWLIALLLLLLRWSCRVRWHDDPRPSLRRESCPYAYAILHCHQVAAIIGCEPGTGAMVSRSTDGDLLVPSLRVHGIVPIRGSTRSKEQGKGGAAALQLLIEHVRGGAPAYLAVDGPRGPRNYVNRGIVKLSLATGAAVLIGVAIPRRRWILARAWDRFQIPKPFTRIDMFFGPPLRLHDGEDLETFRQRIEHAIAALEKQHDPEEATAGEVAAAALRTRLAKEPPT